MADSTGFTPSELDRIEDALEDLEANGLPPDAPAHLSARLADYRSILQMSRRVLPMQEVPAGLLDVVLTEARGEGGSMATQENAVTADGMENIYEHGRGRASAGFWSRVRRTLIVPALALAGSAALVLWVLAPEVGDVGMTQHEGELVVDARNEAPGAAEAPAAPPALEESAPRARAASSPSPPAPEVKLDRKVALNQPAASVGGEPGRAEPTSTLRPNEKARPTGRSAGGTKGASTKSPSKDAWGGGGVAGSGSTQIPQSDAPTPTPAAVTWNQVADADSKRRAGKCGLARIVYRKAIKTADNRVAARGHAGIGLCAERQGDDGTASFARARKLNPRIERFIADERRRAYRPGSKSSRKKTPKAKPAAAADAQENASDPY